MEYKLLNTCTAEITLKEGESVKVFEPKSIILFEGNPERRREDFINPTIDFNSEGAQKNLCMR